MFENSKWIWTDEVGAPDSYAEFTDTFEYNGGSATLYISADSDYTAYINGKYAASSQYGDFEHYKIYDKIDITELLNKGENKLFIIGYHCGVATSRYRPAKAGVIYELWSENLLIAKSSADTLCRVSHTYASGRQLFVSSQLGFTFFYDATKEDSGEYKPAVLVDKTCNFFERPIKKHKLSKPMLPKSVTRLSENRLIFDLGGEVVGFPFLDIESDTEQTITVSWGEHIADGCVRKKIGSRSFYFEYKTKTGQNRFTEYMLRLGCRYLEIESEAPIKISSVGIIPQEYEVDSLKFSFENELDERIYAICLNTLKKCMMEHYVDCPWREQALYAFDSRNQMLCGYYAFSGGNAEYARANLKLIGMDRRPDGLLSICYPCGIELAIPSFSLYYILAMKEYIEHTGDLTLATELYSKLVGVLNEFMSREDRGLINKPSGDSMWNFYDWSRYSDGSKSKYGIYDTDLAINCLSIIALDSFDRICELIGKNFPFGRKADLIREAVRESFLCKNGLYTMHKGEEHFTSLGNTLALLAGVAKKEERIDICDAIMGGTLVDCSLSMKVLEYTALLDTDTEKYKNHILSEIRKGYKAMLDADSDTVWETALGESDFGGAGSLCHGWSAIPIYMYHKLKLITE